jgi:hypothetical protein
VTPALGAALRAKGLDYSSEVLHARMLYAHELLGMSLSTLADLIERDQIYADSTRCSG